MRKYRRYPGLIGEEVAVLSRVELELKLRGYVRKTRKSYMGYLPARAFSSAFLSVSSMLKSYFSLTRIMVSANPPGSIFGIHPRHLCLLP